MKFKHETGQSVWIVLGGDVRFGIVVKRYLEEKKPVYDVRMVEMYQNDDPVEIVAGHGAYEEACGWDQWRCHKKKKLAVMEIYGKLTSDYQTMGRIIQKAPQHFEDADALIKHLKQIEICIVEEVL